MTMFGESGTGPRVPAHVWSAVGTFAFVMLCGIVGPIFLVAYFVIDAPDTEWMLWTGIGVTVLDVLLGVGIAWFNYRGGAKLERLRAAGVFGIAEITSIGQTGVEINDQPMMKLGLRIRADGLVPFEVSTRKVVPYYQQPLLSARRLAVMVDPDTQDFEIDWQATALLAGTVPARFTSEEDGRTYDLTGQAEPLSEILQILGRHGVAGSGVIDLRSNPAARAEVMDVVRGWAGVRTDSATPSRTDSPFFAKPGAGVGGVADAGRSPAERLASLDELRRAGTITEEEYARARQRIVDDL
ncbi:SHOCT domain-containing protein [Gordonia sp. KTR9]|uniref:SHOCT domain-containing protein n=1 Tax=Gordonia sp. KTR9 TaxID=337191 RepID=UPI001EE67C7A|nr:SHOCT domain-containing protein [Gordonia sp. KTR9]